MNILISIYAFKLNVSYRCINCKFIINLIVVLMPSGVYFKIIIKIILLSQIGRLKVFHTNVCLDQLFPIFDGSKILTCIPRSLQDVYFKRQQTYRVQLSQTTIVTAHYCWKECACIEIPFDLNNSGFPERYQRWQCLFYT